MGYWLRDIAPNFDGSCACCSGSLTTFSHSKFGDKVNFEVTCWRTGGQPRGIGVAVSSPTGGPEVRKEVADEVVSAVLRQWPNVEVWVSGIADDWERFSG